MNAKKLASLCLLTAALSACVPNGTKLDSSSKSYDAFELKVSQVHELGGFSEGHIIQYNGKDNDSVFSLSAYGREHQHYPVSSKSIYFYGHDLDVKKVDDKSIILGRQR